MNRTLFPTLLLLFPLLSGCGDPVVLASRTDETPGPGPAAPGAVGFAAENGDRMPVEDVVVVWDATEGTLTVQLFPFRLTDQDRRDARAGGASAVAFHEETPDASRWADWCPFGEWQLGFPEADPTRSPDHLYILSYGFREKNHTGNANVMGGEKGFPEWIEELVLDLEGTPPTVTLKTVGESKVFDTVTAWSLQLEAVTVHIVAGEAGESR